MLGRRTWESFISEDFESHDSDFVLIEIIDQNDHINYVDTKKKRNQSRNARVSANTKAFGLLKKISPVVKGHLTDKQTFGFRPSHNFLGKISL